MACWVSYKKTELQQLAEELGVSIEPNDIKRIIIKKIVEDADYDEALALAEMKIILAEFERVTREAKEREERQAEREFELEKIRLTQQNDTLSISSAHSDKPTAVSLKNVMQKYDPSKSEISLFLNLFERQADKLQIDKSLWTTQLLSLLPVEVAEIVLRQDKSKIDDFEYVKSMLLKRYKLSPEAFRTKFMQCQRATGTLWKDLCFDLESHLSEWIAGMDVKDFESLKQLLVTDQLKRRATHEMRDHFIDSWNQIIDPHILADKLDNYELVKRPMRKNTNYDYQAEAKSEKFKAHEKEVSKPSETSTNWRDRSDRDRTKAFEERKGPRCFLCSEIGHYRYTCPHSKDKDRIGHINFISADNVLSESFAPYLSTAKINGQEMIIMEDSGSNLDLLSRELINEEDFNGKTILVKTPLTTELHSLPLVDVKIKTKYGEIVSEAAVLNSNIPMNHYLLGNETNRLLKSIKSNPKLINSITTFRKTKQTSPQISMRANVCRLEANEKDNRKREGGVSAEEKTWRGQKKFRAKVSNRAVENRFKDLMAARSSNTKEQPERGCFKGPKAKRDMFSNIEEFGKKRFRKNETNKQNITSWGNNTRKERSHFAMKENLETREALLFKEGGRLEERESLVTRHAVKPDNRLKNCQGLEADQTIESRGKSKQWYDRNTAKALFKVKDKLVTLKTRGPNNCSKNEIRPGTLNKRLSVSEGDLTAKREGWDKGLGNYNDVFLSDPEGADSRKRDVKRWKGRSRHSKSYQIPPRFRKPLHRDAKGMSDFENIQEGKTDCTSNERLVDVPGKDPPQNNKGKDIAGVSKENETVSKSEGHLTESKMLDDAGYSKESIPGRLIPHED